MSLIQYEAFPLPSPTCPLEASWAKYLEAEFQKTYMRELSQFLKNEVNNKKIIYPKGHEIFNAFKFTPFEKVKVVILGQDPYHGEGQAHGLSFSVKKGIKVPPSLTNIYQELSSDLKITPPTPIHGNLESWAKEGVLLLNNVLTVEGGLAASHQKKGWEMFTTKVIEVLNEHKESLVFILWGSPAQKKAEFVDQQKHLVLKSVHPSPLSSYRGFFGSQPFSKTNAYLKSKGRGEINWKIT